MVKKLGKGMNLTLAFSITAVCLLIFAYSCSSRFTEVLQINSSEPQGETDPLSVNAACYMCHMGFVKEKMSKTHLNKDITCISCHGLSAGHANDEDIGATMPDVTFARDEVDTMCLECHKRHKISAQDLAKYELHPVCTDCHGSHRINRVAD